MNPFGLQGKLALVTGATRGIGLGAARALAQSGADVLLSGRDAAKLERAAAGLRETGTRVQAFPFDLARTEEIAPWMNRIFDEAGVPDILVNSAGITRRALATELSLEDWNAVLSVNTTAMFEVSRTLARRLIAQRRGGKIVNIASLLTASARPTTSAYTASKGAVGQLTKVLAVEWAQHGILVNAIAPGYIDTEMNSALTSDPAFDAWVKKRCPLGRWGTPADIAWPVVFLASSAADFMTGQVIFVDGGWLATF